MFASPVVYPVNLIPEKWRFFYGLNPMVGVIEGFRWAMLGKASPDFSSHGDQCFLLSRCYLLEAWSFLGRWSELSRMLSDGGRTLDRGQDGFGPLPLYSSGPMALRMS